MSEGRKLKIDDTGRLNKLDLINLVVIRGFTNIGIKNVGVVNMTRDFVSLR